MNALSLYTKTFRMVLNITSGEDASWSPIYEHFCTLRELLLCCACKKIAYVPYTKKSQNCCHVTCKECIGRKPPCDSCIKEKFEEDIQLRMVMQCYKNMCKFIMSCENFRESLLSDLSFPKLNFITMVSEGAKINDEYHYSSTGKAPESKKRPMPSNEAINTQSVAGKRTVYRLRLSQQDYPKVVLNKATFETTMQENSESKEETSPSGLTAFLVQKCVVRVKQRRNCHCNGTTQQPDKLACCGQHCPCYADGKACFNCCCKGCKNPQKFHVASACLSTQTSASEGSSHAEDGTAELLETTMEVPADSS